MKLHLYQNSQLPRTLVFTLLTPEVPENPVLMSSPIPDTIQMDVPFPPTPPTPPQTPIPNIQKIPVATEINTKEPQPSTSRPVQVATTTSGTPLTTINIGDLYAEGSKKLSNPKDSLYLSKMVKFKQTPRKTKGKGKQGRKGYKKKPLVKSGGGSGRVHHTSTGE